MTRKVSKVTEFLTTLGGFFSAVFASSTVAYTFLSKPFRGLNLALYFEKMKVRVDK